ncbi:hypothetical protein BCR35DRAFT_350341 [Leucosporidium creatinivorum]|uniref:MYND-type domain-containing protein n=1 Tax=Leucosporidium creatinivorum TaxID=106004 RepID=A0A1Y2G1E2_9BASI|nr:hypothetical protein BCR35DRAFT_350341 [Leucosporidium creatinivorum]
MSSQAIPTSGSGACQVCKKEGETMRCSKCREVFYCSVDCQASDWKLGHKRTCKGVTKKASSPPLPSVALLLSEAHDAADTFHPIWHLVAPKLASLTTTTSPQAAVDLLESSTTFGALVVQGEIMFDSKDKALEQKLQKLVKSYTLRGGRAILLGGWIQAHDQLKPFAQGLGLKWEVGWYGRTSYEFNKSFNPLNGASLSPPLTPSALTHLSRPLQRTPSSGITLHPGYAKLPAHLRLRGSGRAPPPDKAIFTKSLSLWGVAPKDALYFPTPGARSSLGAELIEPTTALAAMARVGDGGWFGYVGDIEMDEEMAAAVLAMAGCVIKPGVLLP